MTWPDWWVPYVSYFGNGVQQLTKATGSTVSSYVRTPAHNREVGGADRSQHLIGLAVDLVPGRVPMESLATYARSMGFGYVVNEGDHVHVQLYPANVLPQWLFDYLAGSHEA